MSLKYYKVIKFENCFVFRDIEAVCRLCKDFRGDWTDLEDVKKFVLFYFLSARSTDTSITNFNQLFM